MTRALPMNSRWRKPAVRGLTLVELLVVVVIIGIMAGVLMGGLQKTQNVARESRTKATIAKLNHFILLRLESYKTRRISTIDANTKLALVWAPPPATAAIRLYAVRDLMRMEMPERLEDVITISSSSSCGPMDISKQNIVVTDPTSGNLKTVPIGSYFGLPSPLTIPEPSLHVLYADMVLNPSKYGRKSIAATPMAKMLYLTVMTGNSEAREQFQQNEIMADPADGWPMFVDGWGRPIVYLRWAPGCSSGPPGMSKTSITVTNAYNLGISNIQSGDPGDEHDFFDTRNVQPAGPPLTCPDPTNPNTTSPIYPNCGAFQLTPLILSAAGHTMTDSGGKTVERLRCCLGESGKKLIALPLFGLPQIPHLPGLLWNLHSNLIPTWACFVRRNACGVFPAVLHRFDIAACSRSVRQLRL